MTNTKSDLPRHSIHKQLSPQVQQLTAEGRFRSALDMLLPFLDKADDQDVYDSLYLDPLYMLACAVIYLAQSREHAYEATEPLTKEYFLDSRLDPIYCHCDRCSHTWVPNPTGFIANVQYINPLGLHCPNCDKIFCNSCLREGISSDNVVYHCLDCGGRLSGIKKPNGRRSIHRNAREEKLELLIVFREGPIPPDEEIVIDLLQNLSPDAFVDVPDLIVLPIFPWEEEEKLRHRVLMIGAVKGVFPAPNLTDYQFATDKDGNRYCIVKIYKPRAVSETYNSSTVRGIGVMFDIDDLGGGYYGAKAWRIFMKHLEPSFLTNCVLLEGDTNATLSDQAREFCIAVQGIGLDTDYVESALSKADEKGLCPISRRFIQELQLSKEPLLEVGEVDQYGRFVEDTWSRAFHDRCKDSGWGYAPKRIAVDLSPKLKAELKKLTKRTSG